MKLAGEIRVGDVVEFELGSPVRVVAIEENWTDEPDPSPYSVEMAGKSLVFDCVFADEWENALPVSTFYVRRERSPINGPRVWR
jgi:hypothetical protein